MPPIVKSPLKFGAIGSIIVIFIFLAYYLLGSNPLIEMNMIDIFILPIFLFFGIKEFRDSHNQQQLKYWEGMTAGLVIYSSLALVSSIFIFVFIKFIDTSLIMDFVSDRLAGLDEVKKKIVDEMGEKSFQDTVDGVLKTSAYDIALDGFLKKLTVGFLLTSVIAVVMKRNTDSQQVK